MENKVLTRRLSDSDSCLQKGMHELTQELRMSPTQQSLYFPFFTSSAPSMVAQFNSFLQIFKHTIERNISDNVSTL